MNIIISNASEKPIYQQVFEQISAQILKGELEKDVCLPPIRQAAKELRISIITVKTAWEELERRGLIYSVTGKGCFVADLSQEDRIHKRDEMIIGQMEKDISYYRSFGLSLEEVLELMKQIY